MAVIGLIFNAPLQQQVALTVGNTKLFKRDSHVLWE